GEGQVSLALERGPHRQRRLRNSEVPMPVSRGVRCCLILAASLAWAGIARAEGPTPTFPAGKSFKAPKPIKKPGTIADWRAILVCDDPPIFKGPTGPEKLSGAKAKFG